MTGIPLLPREHGAYVQLGIALAAGLLLGQGTLQAFFQALLTAIVFLASVPALALRRDSEDRRAVRRLVLLACLGVVCGSLAWWNASVTQWRTLLVPVLLASALAALAFMRQEHTTYGELLAAGALSSAAYPVAVLGGAGAHSAVLMTSILSAMQCLGTTTVRSFLGSLRGKGSPWFRTLPLGLGAALMALCLSTPLPRILALAVAPMTLAAAWILVAPPLPRHMKRVGWVLSLASLVGILPAIFELRQ
jgi:hypothetical protein